MENDRTENPLNHGADTRRTVALAGRMTAMSSGRANLASETGNFTVTGGEAGFGGVETKAEAGSVRTDTPLPLKAGAAVGQTVGGAEADAMLDATEKPLVLSSGEITLETLPPITGTANIVEENDTLEARGTIGASTGTATAGAEVNGVGAAVDFAGTFDVVVIPAIWHSQGFDLFPQIDRAAQELEAVRLLLLTLQSSRSDDMLGHNSLPGLLGAPDIDLEAIEAAIQCLVVLRSVISQPRPDFEIVALLWRVVLAALKAMGRLAAWAARTTKALFNDFLDTTMGKAFAKGFGTTVGASAAAGIVYEITQHGPEGLQAVGQVLKGVLAALGHPG